jgi:hypothetical protein
MTRSQQYREYSMSRMLFRSVIFALGLTALMPMQSLLAQAARGSISGEVRDPSGSVIPNVEVRLVEVHTNQGYQARADDRGFYTVLSLMPGTYNLIMESSGFKKFTQEGIELATGEKLRVDAKLAVGDVSESILVTADAPLLRTEDGSLGQVIPNRTIVELPLNGRNYLGLVGLAAGVANPPNSTTPRINGGRPRVNEYLYDGISVLLPEPGQVALYPVIEAIQEFKLETNSPSAEFGRFNGGVVNLATKSGTNQFHGSAFEFFRNEVLNARNLFAPATAANPQKPAFRRNQFGGVLGGPIVGDKTFFFVDYQGTRQLINRVRTSTVPTLLQRQGIFTEKISGVTPAVYDPATTISKAGGGFTRTQFASNTIPSASMDAVALQLLNRFPLPTASGTANNYTRSANEPDNLDQFDTRIDQAFSRDHLFGRYSYSIDKSSPVTPLPEGSGNLASGFIGKNSTLGQSFASGFMHSFSTRTANEFRAGYTRRAVTQVGTELDSPPSQAISLSGIPSNASFSNILPTFTINGIQQLGSPSSASLESRTDVTEIVDMLSFWRGRHTIKAGLDFRWARLDIIQPPQPTGVFNFSTVGTDLPGITGTGNALASFLLGQVNTFSIDLQQKVIRPRAHIQEYFLQDDWKASRNLTVNAGLRYTLNFPSTEVDNQGAVFNRSTQQLDYLGRNGFPESARELHKANFGPRLGLAYRIGDKTVVRSGYALVWIEQSGITTPFTNPQFPYIQTATNRTLDSVNPAFVLSKGPSVPPASLTPDAALGQGAFTVDRDLGSGYVQQWNLTMEREIANNLVLAIAYSGNKITHIGIPDTNINQLTVEQLQAGSALTKSVTNPYYGLIPRQSSLGNPTISAAQLLKPYPKFTTVSFFRNNVGNSHYDSMQVRLERRTSKGMAFLVSYTRSKLLDDASSVFSNTIFTGPVTNYPVADSYNRHLERDVSLGDMPNVFSTTVTYDLPLGPGHGLGTAGLGGKLVEGWKVNTIISMQSGIPLALTQATNNNAFAGFGVQRPNLVGNPVLDNPSTAMWFNTAAFQAAPQFTIGTCSRNPVRGPGVRNMDLSLIKNTKLQERVNMEFRAEFFNFTNTPPLGAPAVVFGNAGFGTITSAGDPRVIQFGLKVTF